MARLVLELVLKKLFPIISELPLVHVMIFVNTGRNMHLIRRKDVLYLIELQENCFTTVQKVVLVGQ